MLILKLMLWIRIWMRLKGYCGHPSVDLRVLLLVWVQWEDQWTGHNGTQRINGLVIVEPR